MFSLPDKGESAPSQIKNSHSSLLTFRFQYILMFPSLHNEWDYNMILLVGNCRHKFSSCVVKLWQEKHLLFLMEDSGLVQRLYLCEKSCLCHNSVFLLGFTLSVANPCVQCFLTLIHTLSSDAVWISEKIFPPGEQWVLENELRRHKLDTALLICSVTIVQVLLWLCLVRKNCLSQIIEVLKVITVSVSLGEASKEWYNNHHNLFSFIKLVC